MSVKTEQQLLSDVGIMLNYTADEISEDKTLRDRLKLIIKNGVEHLRSFAPDFTAATPTATRMRCSTSTTTLRFWR